MASAKSVLRRNIVLCEESERVFIQLIDDYEENKNCNSEKPEQLQSIENALIK